MQKNLQWKGKGEIVAAGRMLKRAAKGVGISSVMGKYKGDIGWRQALMEARAGAEIVTGGGDLRVRERTMG